MSSKASRRQANRPVATDVDYLIHAETLLQNIYLKNLKLLIRALWELKDPFTVLQT